MTNLVGKIHFVTDDGFYLGHYQIAAGCTPESVITFAFQQRESCNIHGLGYVPHAEKFLILYLDFEGLPLTVIYPEEITQREH